MDLPKLQLLPLEIETSLGPVIVPLNIGQGLEVSVNTDFFSQVNQSSVYCLGYKGQFS